MLRFCATVLCYVSFLLSAKTALSPGTDVASGVGDYPNTAMIRPERLTVKAAEALQQASALARARGNPVINDAHLFLALLSQDDGIVVPLLQKAGLNVTQLSSETEREIDRFPRQSGTTAEPTLSREVSRVLDRADEEAKALGDAYVSTEHVLLALLEEKGTTAKQLLSAAGVDRDDLMAALQGVRGSHRVTDQEPEQKYQALERYTRDLTELARKGKIDPVIGRDEEIRRVMQALSRRRRGGDGCLQHAEARVGARRAACGGCHHARRIPQAHREGRRARAAFPTRLCGRAVGRGHDRHSARSQGALRGAPRRAHHG